jgi:hypothetical protein
LKQKPGESLGIAPGDVNIGRNRIVAIDKLNRSPPVTAKIWVVSQFEI